MSRLASTLLRAAASWRKTAFGWRGFAQSSSFRVGTPIASSLWPKIARSAQRCAVFGLPLSAIFSLRKASHKTVKLIGNRIEAGESAPSAREAARLARSPDTNIQSWPYGLRPPPETNAPTRTYASVTTTLTEREPPLNAERFQEIQAHDLANQIATLRQRLENAEPEAVLSALRPEERRWLIEDAEEIMDFLGALVDALKPKAVSWTALAAAWGKTVTVSYVRTTLFCVRECAGVPALDASVLRQRLQAIGLSTSTIAARVASSRCAIS
jgi:hypothetical protein